MRRTALLTLLALLFPGALVGAAEFDTDRYMPLSEVRPGMTGVGRTTLEGTRIVEFQFTVKAVLRNMAPKQDAIIVECRGANLEETGIIAGMSGSPCYIDDRLIGAIAFGWAWNKRPIGGVQPIEQMLEVTDTHPWAKFPTRKKSAAKRPDPISVPLASLGLGRVPKGLAGRSSVDLVPLKTPLIVSGASARTMKKLRAELEPRGLVPLAGGGTERRLPVAAKLEPGAPVGVVLARGDMDITGMGTITDIREDRLLAFGHAMFGAGKANFPMTTGVAHVVIPSLSNSFRLGAPVEEIGRLTWDESTAVFGRIGEARAPMTPVKVAIRGPDPAPDGKGPELREFDYEIIQHWGYTPVLAAMTTIDSFTVRRTLPDDHTLRYTVRVKPAGYDAIVHDNVVTSPVGPDYVAAEIRNVVGMLMNNPYKEIGVESVTVEAEVVPTRNEIMIRDARSTEHVLRPGATTEIEVKIRRWLQDPEWTRVAVTIPADTPDGEVTVTVSGGDEALRDDFSENPGRYRVRDADSLVEVLRLYRPRGAMYVRLSRPGAGLTIGRTTLPNLPKTMRSVLSEAAREPVSGVGRSIVKRLDRDALVTGRATVTLTVDRTSPEK